MRTLLKDPFFKNITQHNTTLKENEENVFQTTINNIYTTTTTKQAPKNDTFFIITENVNTICKSFSQEKVFQSIFPYHCSLASIYDEEGGLGGVYFSIKVF